MGKEKDKKPLFGGIFQKFFKPSAKAEAKKKKEHHLTVQRSIPYLEMGRDGICRVEEHLYSKTVRFYDINYQLAQNEDKNTIFESWCDFLNYFDSSIRFQLSFINHKSDMSEYNKVIQIEPQHDQFDDVRMEYEAIILKSDFEKVQSRREQNKENRDRAMARSKESRAKCYNHLAGMVYCGCCRHSMVFERRVHGTVKEIQYGMFVCKRKKNTTPCAYHTVTEKMLMMVAMDQIHHLVSTMCEEEKLVKEMMRGSNLDSARSIKMKENSILFRIQEAEERRLRLYEDYKAEILDEDEYSQLKEHYIAEKQRLEHELQKQRQRAMELEKRIKIGRCCLESRTWKILERNCNLPVTTRKR